MVCGLAGAGCSLFRPVPAPPPPAVKVEAPPPAPVLPKPVATDRFEIDAKSGDVVGYVQKTVIGKEDTLPDIARRFDVGYEEMVLANPGVDPWLPGVGREVVVPTQFVLPAAPRQGVVINVAAMRIFYYPPHKKGEQLTRLHASDRHRQGGLEDSRRHDEDRQPGEGSRVGRAEVGARRACRGRRHAAGQGAGGAGQSLGPVCVPAGLAQLSDPRHQQALRRRHARRATAACGCIPRTSRYSST